MVEEDKKIIYSAFVENKLEILSCSINKKVEWKKITDATKHDVRCKKQYNVVANGGESCEVTEDHSLFINKDYEIKPQKTKEFNLGDPLVLIKDNKCISENIIDIKEIQTQEYMYDLSVEDNHNFVLESGILAHNSFRPPSHEKFLQSQTQVFGYIWEDEELYEYLLMAIDDLNAAPPVTGITLKQMPGRWRTSIVLRAASFACFAVAMNWIADEFDYSISGVSLSIDKSSKYEAMKRNFIEEWDKARDLIKRSIKIVKGLRQPRYGVGISSALGPYSRPGVQSRRNYISGFRGGWA